MGRVDYHRRAFAISKAMSNSGFAAFIAEYIIGMTDALGPYALLAVIFCYHELAYGVDNE